MKQKDIGFFLIYGKYKIIFRDSKRKGKAEVRTAQTDLVTSVGDAN